MVKIIYPDGGSLEMGKRKKDDEFTELHEALSDLSYLIEDYIEALGVIKDDGNGTSSTSEKDLQERIDTANALMELVEENLWMKLIRVAGISSAISHRRAGDFF
jgi:hypothetical protein